MAKKFSKMCCLCNLFSSSAHFFLNAMLNVIACLVKVIQVKPHLVLPMIQIIWVVVSVAK